MSDYAVQAVEDRVDQCLASCLENRQTIHKYTCTYTFLYTHTHKHARTRTYTYTHTYKHTHTHQCLSLPALCLCVWVCLCGLCESSIFVLLSIIELERCRPWIDEACVPIPLFSQGEHQAGVAFSLHIFVMCCRILLNPQWNCSGCKLATIHASL